MKPIIKWVGGKSQLLNELNARKPEQFNNYFELFVGGGAFALNLNKDKTTISDLNEELINMYQCIRDNVDEVIEIINQFKVLYNENPEKFYYELRNLDKDENFIQNNTNNFRAARKIFLNKTCFNGLYRVNSKNQFNVPWNQNQNTPGVYDEKNLIEVSSFLKKINIKNQNYKDSLKDIKKGDFVYLDPPYDKVKKDTFVDYTKDNFGEKEQEELADFAKLINNKNAYFMISNHNTPLINELYKDFKIEIVHARRNVNSKGNNRGIVEEVIITNY
ncbi:DNA adenine methylase [Williamsoniiplasma luminosum]|uniref:Site-specific DNA-methyltransferase (adenine-specific) n=1 Tax=Williamsoniiplasma luminosum TaxID=214888 RepID=A0A2S0NKY6_9MOLU|nr:Dam family site-specific DNA-(adenine-N6)-methyltransferase [Williamsoniiplasma luminosum]AVP49665.1 MAG: hypothetical protein C5T88_03765 [Williamsoniiplasma luminosum]